MLTTNRRKEAFDRESPAVIFIHKHRESLAMILTLALSALIGGMVV